MLKLAKNACNALRAISAVVTAGAFAGVDVECDGTLCNRRAMTVCAPLHAALSQLAHGRGFSSRDIRELFAVERRPYTAQRTRPVARPLSAVDSTSQRNTFAEHLSGRVEAERLTRPLVQLSRDRVELEL